jgi:hypothetical protein
MAALTKWKILRALLHQQRPLQWITNAGGIVLLDFNARCDSLNAGGLNLSESL